MHIDKLLIFVLSFLYFETNAQTKYEQDSLISRKIADSLRLSAIKNIGNTSNTTWFNYLGNIDDYAEIKISNQSVGSKAQSGFTAQSNTGNSITGFAWMGINNSNFNFPTSYNIGLGNDVTYIGSGNDMHIANASINKDIIFSTGKVLTPFFNERLRITNKGEIKMSGSVWKNFDPLRASTTNYVIKDTDYALHITGIVSQAITLPAASLSKNRELRFVNHTLLNVILSSSYRTASGTTTTTISAGSEITIASDGIEWSIMSN